MCPFNTILFIARLSSMLSMSKIHMFCLFSVFFFFYLLKGGWEGDRV